MRKKINKLLRALEQKGVIYCVDRRQFYSKNNNRRCTKITVHRSYTDDTPKDEREINQYFWSDVEVVQFLANRYKEVNV